MTLAKEPKSSPSSAPVDVIFPSGEPYSNEPPLETELHLQQMILLLNCLHWLWREREDYFAAGNLSIYYSPRQLKSEDMRGPDFFVVLGVEKRSRRSWTVWEEGGKYPNIIVEILSDSTADNDRKLKKGIYQDIFRTPDYFWFDPHSQEFAGFHLVSGQYVPLKPNAEGWLWSEQLQLFLGIREGKLRYFTPAGELVPTTEEVALQEQQRAELAEEQVLRSRQEAEREREEALRSRQEAEREREEALRSRQEAAQEREKSQRLAERLRALGIDPDEL